jgi:1,4-alpha-glucan branching enzyme
MSFSNKEQGQYKEALLPRARDIDALVRAEHHDPQFSAPRRWRRWTVHPRLSAGRLERTGAGQGSGEELGNLEPTQTPGLFVGHFDRAQSYLLRTRWAGGEQIAEDPTALVRCSAKWICTCSPKAITAT